MFERPVFAVRGARQYDQDWIDGNVEAGVGACGWQRPQPRPAELDSGGAPPRKAAVKKKKPSLVKRIKARIVGPPTVVEVPPEIPVAAPPVAPPPAPVDPVDELLGTKR